jgi:LPXTG-motif cell wall-anchored protein
VHVRSAAGNPVAGKTVTLAGHNAHLFTSTVTTGRTGDATFSYSVPSSVGSPNFSIDAATTVPVLLRYTYLGPVAPHMPQDVVGSSTRPVKTTAAGAVDPYLSNLTFIKYTTGDSGKTPVAGAVFSVTDLTQGRLLGSITSQATPVSLAGANIAAGDTLRFVETQAPPGHYSQGPVTVTIPATATAGYQVQIPNPATPTIALSTQVNAALASVSKVLADQVTVSGDDGEDGTDTATLLGPLQPDTSSGTTAAGLCGAIPADQWAAAPVVGTYTLAVDGSVQGGNGTATVTGTSTTAAGTGPGCYGWRHHLVLTPSGATADSGPADPGESMLVMYPSATTRASMLDASTGSYLTDTVTLMGSYGQPVQVTGQVLTAQPQRIGRGMSCPLPVSGAWTSGDVVASIGPFTVTGDGPHPVPGRYLTTQALCYSFAYQASVILDPNAADPSARAIPLSLPAGQPGETALISPPAITTSSSATSTSPATTITDQIRIAGLQLPAGDTAVLRAYYLATEPILPTAGSNTSTPACANAAVLDQLPAEGRPAQAGCNPTGWENTPIAATPAPITITGDGTYTTDPITLPATPGYGSWVETLTHNGITVTLTPAGTPSETVHAVTPTIGTAAASTDASSGGAILSDTLDVTGLQLQPGDTAAITAHVLTALSDGTSCDGVDWSVADHDGEPTNLNLPGDGHYRTTPVPVGLGCHSFYEQLAINGHLVAIEAEQPGQPSETLLITAPAGPIPTPTPAPTPSGSPTGTPTGTATPTPPHSSTPPSPPASSSQPPTDSGGGHSLANTGTNIGSTSWAGLTVVALGITLLLLARRRRADRGQGK